MNEAKQVTKRTYVFGFSLSLLLTLCAYFFVVEQTFSPIVIFYAIVGLGLLQALIQLFCFLHLGKEAKPRWNLLVFLFMLMVIAIIVTGSLFIMQSLNHRLMPSMGVLNVFY